MFKIYIYMHATCDIYARQFQKCVVVMLGPSGAWEEAESIPFHGVKEGILVGLLHLGSDLTYYLGDHGSRYWETSVGFSGHQRPSVGGSGGLGGADVQVPNAGASHAPGG